MITELARRAPVALVGGMDKARLLSAIIQKISADLDTVTRAAQMAHDEATHEESKPENQYDMHSQEAAYLAEGQARLAAELNETLNLYQALAPTPWKTNAPVGIGAVVTLEAPKRVARYFIGPRSGGLELQVDGEEITVVTPASPLGRRLLGATIDSIVQLPSAGAPVAHRVTRIE